MRLVWVFLLLALLSPRIAWGDGRSSSRTADRESPSACLEIEGAVLTALPCAEPGDPERPDFEGALPGAPGGDARGGPSWGPTGTPGIPERDGSEPEPPPPRAVSGTA